MNFSVHQWAAVALTVMAGVIIWMDWVPTPLNRNIRAMSVRERLPGSIIHLAVGGLLVVANLAAFKWGILVGAVWCSMVLFAAIRNWWLAYFAGVYWGEITPDIYLAHYTQNVRMLPPFKQRPVVPDVQHMLIHAAVLVAAVLSWASFWWA